MEKVRPVRIRVIGPVVLGDTIPETVAQYVSAAPPGCSVDVVYLEEGPASIEDERDEALAAPGTIARVQEAEREGIDAVVISCLLDPGLHAARESVRIPVLGPGQTAMHMAAMLAGSFSIVSVTQSIIAPLQRRAQQYGLSPFLKSVYSVDIPVLDVESNRAEAFKRLLQASSKAVQQDGAGSIILGCTRFTGLAEEIHEALKQGGLAVPVIDPALLCIRLAASLVFCGLSHDKGQRS